MTVIGELQVKVTADTTAMMGQIQAQSTAAGRMAGQNISAGMRGGMTGGLKGVGDEAAAAGQLASKKFSKSLQDGLTKSSGIFQKVGQSMSQAGASLTKTVTLPIVGIGAASMYAAVQFEEAFAGVRKTVDATEAEYAALSDGIRKMSTEIPSSAGEIAKVAEAAGQLGIEKDNILAFSRTMIDLGNSTNLTSDAAATALARFANITQMPQEQFQNLGSVIVELGNNFATTEAEIVDMGMRLAGAGKQVGLTEPQIMGLATALSSVGLEAEAGGTALSRTMMNIQKAVMTGGAELENFARIAGTSAQDFADQFSNAPEQAIVTFVQGLKKISDEGGNVMEALESVGAADIRVRDALLRAAGAGDLLGEALGMADQAWMENSALTEEAAKRYATTASQFTILKNKIMDVAVTLGEALIPVALDAIDAMQPLFDFVKRTAEAFSELPKETQQTILTLTGIAAAAGPVLLILGKISGAIGAIMGSGGLAGLLGGLGAAAGPVAAVVAAIAALAAAFYAAWQISEDFREGVMGAFNAIKDAIGGAIDNIKSKINENMDGLSVWIDAFKAVADFVGNYIMPIIAFYYSSVFSMIGNIIGWVIEAVSALGQAFRTAAPAILDFARTVVETIGNMVDAVLGFLQTLVEGAAGALDWVPGIGDALNDAKTFITDYRKTVSDAYSGMASALGNQANSIRGFGGAAATAAGQTREYARAITSVNDALSDSNALLDYEDAIDRVTEAFKENTKKISVNDAAGRDLVRTVTDLASKTQEQAASTDNVSEKSRIAGRALATLKDAMGNAKMDPATAAAMLGPFQSLIDELRTAGADVSGLQSQLNALQSKNITITATVVRKGDYIGGGIPIGGYKIATGGLVRGPGTSTSDSIPAMLSNGEFVVRAAAVKQVGVGYLSALNKGTLPAGRTVSMGSAAWSAPGGSQIGRAGGVTYEVVVNNPAPEKASESLPQALRRASFVAGYQT